MRPSQLHGVDDPFVAYCFDRAVTTWGLHVEHAVQLKVEAAKTRNAAKRVAQSTMDKYMYADRPESAPGRFRDPAAR